MGYLNTDKPQTCFACNRHGQGKLNTAEPQTHLGCNRHGQGKAEPQAFYQGKPDDKLTEVQAAVMNSVSGLDWPE